VQPPAEYAAWHTAQSQPATLPVEPLRQRGHAMFLSQGCASCHTVRGTAASGTLGPDLTHVGSRRMIGAGLLPNTIGALGGWIANSQALKPGNRMPAFHDLPGADLQALAAYMESLR